MLTIAPPKCFRTLALFLVVVCCLPLSTSARKPRPPAGIDELISQASEEESSTRPCQGQDAETPPSVAVSPLSKKGTVLVTMEKPADFATDDSVKFDIVQHPAQVPNATVLDVDEKNQIFVAVDRFYNYLDQGFSYDQPQTIVVEVSGSVKGQKCLIFFNMDLFNTDAAVNVAWESDPVLESAYHLSYNQCPLTPITVIGRIGAGDTLNKVYNITYGVEENTAAGGETTSGFKLWPTTGIITTVNDSGNQPEPGKYQFQVSASALGQYKALSTVFIDISCERQPTRMRGAHASPPPNEQRLKFSATCAETGDVIGQLPQSQSGGKDAKFTSYVMYPEEKAYSITADGQIRVLRKTAGNAAASHQQVHINAQTASGRTTVFTVDIELKPCDKVLSDAPATVLSKLGDVHISCPFAGELITDLNALPEYKKRLPKDIKEKFLAADRTDVVQITQSGQLYFSRLPASFNARQPLQVAISLHSRANKKATQLGFINIVFLTNSKNDRKPQQCSTTLQQQQLRRNQVQSVTHACVRANQPIAYLNTPMSNSYANSRVQFRLDDGAPYYRVEPNTGIVYVMKPPPADVTTSVLGVTATIWPDQMYTQTIFNGLPITYQGLLYVYITGAERCGDQADAVTSPAYDTITCEKFNSSVKATADDPLRIGVVFEGKDDSGMKKSSRLVTTVYADLSTSSSTDFSTPAFKWSIVGSNDADNNENGYRIDPFSGNILQVSDKPARQLTVRATSVEAPALSCELTIEPYVIGTADSSFAKQHPELLNRRPPRFNRRSIWQIDSDKCEKENGFLHFPLQAGLNLGRVVAVDSDSGRAGAITYSLCGQGASKLNCELSNVEVRLWNSGRKQPSLSLAIDPNSGNVFVKQNVNVSQAISYINMTVQAANMFRPTDEDDFSGRQDFIGVPARKSIVQTTLELLLTCLTNKNKS